MLRNNYIKITFLHSLFWGPRVRFISSSSMIVFKFMIMNALSFITLCFFIGYITRTLSKLCLIGA